MLLSGVITPGRSRRQGGRYFYQAKNASLGRQLPGVVGLDNYDLATPSTHTFAAGTFSLAGTRNAGP